MRLLAPATPTVPHEPAQLIEATTLRRERYTIATFLRESAKTVRLARRYLRKDAQEGASVL